MLVGEWGKVGVWRVWKICGKNSVFNKKSFDDEC